MTFPPLDAGGRDPGGPAGYTYAGVLVRVEALQDDVLTALREIRFTGWVAPPQDGWLVAVPGSGAGTVAAGRRGVADVGGWLAERLATTVLAVRVVRDRQLLLAMWADGAELGRYVSDPSQGPEADDETLPEPVGAENAAAFAEACARPDAAEDLADLLAEELDPDSVIESERLTGVLRLLGLPTWLVAASSLPHDIPTGPAVRDMTRLGAGVPGVLGRLCGPVVNVVRRRRPPPPAITDVPHGRSDVDPWLL